MQLATRDVSQEQLRRFWWQCGRKRRHGDKKVAHSYAKKWQRIEGIFYHAYKCPYCNGWHVGQRKWYRKHIMREGGR